MIIGIDLDNTIIDYRNSFWQTALAMGILKETAKKSIRKKEGSFPNKNEIKSYLLCLENGDYQWESLQGQAYGRYIHNATIFPGVVNFLMHCKNRGEKVYIISHKTEFGHHDKSQTPLREAALNFLDNNGLLSENIGIRSEDVFFFSSRQGKLNKIAELNCDYFIDDLPNIFKDPDFPKHTKKIIFDIHSECGSDNNPNSWWRINELLLSIINENDIAAYVESGLNKEVKAVNKIKGRKNSRVYKIEMDSGQEYAGKLYPDQTFDDRNRLEKEIKAYKFLHKHGIKSVPEVIWSNSNLNFGLFGWIDGTNVNEITDDYVLNAAEIVKLLDELSKHTSYGQFKLATAACLSGQMIEEQIRDRYKTIHEYSNFNIDLNSFLENNFIKTFDKILLHAKKLWPGKFETKLSNDHQLLSPSDFGFHNTLLTKKGLKFIDFEYFGWDDPVKLTCDFLLHPGMFITDKQKTLWLNRIIDIFSDDNYFYQRLTASYCLYGLCWGLIILNVFFTDHRMGKNVTDVIKSDLEKKQTKQLKKSMKLIDHINEVHKHGFPYE